MSYETYRSQRVFVGQNLVWMIALHVLALVLAPLYFRWDALGFGIFFTLLFGYSMGIFHHMYLTHNSFRATRGLAYMGALFGTLTWRGPFSGPVSYVALHNIHHAYADTDLDPHSPVRGRFFSLLGWFWQMPESFLKQKDYLAFAPAVAANSFYLFLDRNVHTLQLAWAFVCFGVGTLVGYFTTGHGQVNVGFSFVVYGVLVRAVLGLYLMNAVDLINHSKGYRNFSTTDRSTNSFIMASIHLGGAISWHNNHHAYPDYFTVQARWWEIDAHYLFLRALERLGLVSDIKIIRLNAVT